uniref:GLTP domain-containing protein n=1 Tax=Caenorhabditis tropicalis TaxID=1561998 RepID=A0A1I7UNY9_9PELO
MTDSPKPFCLKFVATQMKKLSTEKPGVIEVIENVEIERSEKNETPEDVELLTFVEVYEELCKFIKMLGKIFEFVEKDVREKIDLLRELHSADPEGYKTVETMIDSEKTVEKKDKVSGVVAILHLNRALEFIIEFMDATVEATNDDSIPKICKECYDGTLAKHHPWIIRAAVKVAVYTLPSRDKMLEYIRGTSLDESHVKGHIDDVVNHGKVVHGRINTIYTVHELHKIA